MLSWIYLSREVGAQVAAPIGARAKTNTGASRQGGLEREHDDSDAATEDDESICGLCVLMVGVGRRFER
jgi:hypothetical protein